MKPMANNIGVASTIRPPHIVAIQENILIPVGTAIIIVAAVKYVRVSTSEPTVYMWCQCTHGQPTKARCTRGLYHKLIMEKPTTSQRGPGRDSLGLGP